MDSLISILLLLVIIILLIWDILLRLIQKKQPSNENKEYFELNSKLNFIIAVGTLAILLVTYLGFDVKEEILKKSEEPIKNLIKAKSLEIDSLLESKNILKAGIYIINDLNYKEDSVYKFEDLLTIDNKNLPNFAYPPKLIINTSTGENLRIKKVTNDCFILSSPIQKSSSLLIGENPNYPKNLKFDIWIADYKTN